MRDLRFLNTKIKVNDTLHVSYWPEMFKMLALPVSTSMESSLIYPKTIDLDLESG